MTITAEYFRKLCKQADSPYERLCYAEAAEEIARLTKRVSDLEQAVIDCCDDWETSITKENLPWKPEEVIAHYRKIASEAAAESRMKEGP
jgi:hypothetical protein